MMLVAPARHQARPTRLIPAEESALVKIPDDLFLWLIFLVHDAVVSLVTPVDKFKHQHGPGGELAGAARSVGHFVWGAQLEAKHGQIQANRVCYNIRGHYITYSCG